MGQAKARRERGDAGAVHFSCTGCGKCCNTPPTMSLREGFAHAGGFLMQGMIYVMARHHGPAMSREITERLFELDSVRVRSGSFDTVVNLSIHPVQPPALPCPQLRGDGLCAIHATRPQTCRVVPMQTILKARHQATAIAMFARGGVAEGFECLWDAGQPTIWTTDGIAPGPMLDAYAAAEAEERHDVALMRALVEGGMREWALANDLDVLARVRRTMTTGNPRIVLPPLALLRALREAVSRGILPAGAPLPDDGTFAAAQLACARRLIEAMATRDGAGDPDDAVGYARRMAERYASMVEAA